MDKESKFPSPSSQPCKPEAPGARMSGSTDIDSAVSGDYKYGFSSDIDTEIIPKGLNEDVIRFISARKGEPDWLLEFRLKAYRYWLTLTPPHWALLAFPNFPTLSTNSVFRSRNRNFRWEWPWTP